MITLRSNSNAKLELHNLDADHAIGLCRLPERLLLDAGQFDALWNLHPKDRPEIFLHGRRVKIPRFQQAYGHDYHFSGRTSEALGVPEILAPLHQWSRDVIDPRLNGLLVNWYDAQDRHYIGAHRDKYDGLIEDAPIVTISLGATRIFRMRPYKGKGFADFEADNGRVFILPFLTNLAFTHETTHRASDRGRRISVTLRALK